MVLYENNLCCGLINVDLDFYIIVELDLGSRVNGCLYTKALLLNQHLKDQSFIVVEIVYIFEEMD
jgi:hypothetical protein